MSEKNFKRMEWNASGREIRTRAYKYIDAIVKIWDGIETKKMEEIGKEMAVLGYAIGVIAGKLSDCGIEGFSGILSGVKMSIDLEKRDEKMTYAIWDKEGSLHTSEEGYRTEKGGQS